VEDFVVVAEDNLPPQQWMIGRVVAALMARFEWRT